MSTSQSEHAWFCEQITAYLAGGLSEPEQTRFADHLASCEQCASKLRSLEKEDQAMQAVFAAVVPGAEFEQKIIAGLRHRWTPRLVIHPMVRKAAAGVAAVLVLGALGYATSSMLSGDGLPQITATDSPGHWPASGGFGISKWPLGRERAQVASNHRATGLIDIAGDTTMADRSVPRQPRPGIDMVGGTSLPHDEKGVENRQADEAIQRTSGRQAADTKDKARTVTDLIRQTRTYIGQDDYAQGLATLDQIQRLDPSNAYATSVRPLVEDRAILSQQRQYREHFSTELRKQSNQPEEKKTAYDDIYRYPANWPDVSDARSRGGKEAEKEGVARAGSWEMSISGAAAVSASKTPVAFYGMAKPAAPVVADAFKPTELALGDDRVPDGGTVLLGGTTLGRGVMNINSADGTMLASSGRVFVGANKNSAAVPVNSEDGVLVPWAADNDSDAKAPKATGKQIAAATPSASVVSKSESAARTDDKPTGEQPAKPAASAVPPVEQPADAGMQRKIIRNGQMEFEVESFDSAFVQISKIVLEERGFVASTESEKLSNGKMTGTVTLRVAPEHLDTLILKLRALGDLKNQKIVAQDITKQYTDLESQLRAARAMEQRLLEIIKTGKGEIKDLVAAEKELGVWREKIEQVEGEARYYNGQIALSTLRITLSEKDVKAAAFASETELRSIGIETEDVEKSYATAQELVNEFKGRIVGATLKKLDAGQFAASIICDVAPESAGPMTDRLKQLGKVARLEAERKQTPGEGAEAPLTSKVQRKDARFIISLYNLANIAPRETTTVNLACRDVESAYRAILLRVAKAGGRIVGSNLNQLKADQTTGTVSLQVKTEDADALLAELRKPGGAADTEVTRLSTTENTDTSNVTTAKRGFAVQIVSLASVAPRETITLRLAVPSVSDAYKALTALLGNEAMQSRILSSQLSEQDRQNVTGSLDFEIRRGDLPAIDKAMASAGEVFSRSATRATEAENTIDSKVRITATLINADNLAPRELATMGIEVANVEKTMGDIAAATVGLKGRSVESRLSKEPSGRITGRLVIDVPLAKSAEILATVREQGTVRTVDTTKNTQVPDGALARTRLDITISNGEGIVANDRGLWATVRNGLATSVAGLLWSLELIVVGLFLVGPWVLVIWGGWKLVRRGKGKSAKDSAIGSGN